MAETIVYDWRATNPILKGKWRTLGWRMTEAEAAEWSAGANPCRQIEKIEGTQEIRTELEGASCGRSFIQTTSGHNEGPCKPILLVEDSRNDELITLRALQRLRIKNEIIVARDGVEALDYLFAKGRYSTRDVNETPQLILLDLQLPKLNGLQVLRALRGTPQTKLTPVVIFTSSDEETDKLKSYSLGANGYVRKSMDLGGFMEAVRRIGLYWLESNDAPDAITSIAQHVQ